MEQPLIMYTVYYMVWLEKSLHSFRSIFFQCIFKSLPKRKLKVGPINFRKTPIPHLVSFVKAKWLIFNLICLLERLKSSKFYGHLSTQQPILKFSFFFKYKQSPLLLGFLLRGLLISGDTDCEKI